MIDKRQDEINREGYELFGMDYDEEHDFEMSSPGFATTIEVTGEGVFLRKTPICLNDISP